ncbi:MAG: DNA mismatch repair protein MutS [Betaproteobacteria bacterium HGW-Betaproteobacteria-11]|nr:MAG: DNA mismatch repair protein MutS [Betaproteobacteria bacterium HGW-Betaproteobacteria-11]
MAGGGRGGKPAPILRAEPDPQPATADTDERALFRAAVADARPLHSDRADLSPPPPPAIPRQRVKDETAALVASLHEPLSSDQWLEGGDETAWRRDGVPLRVLRDLRRGRWSVQASLDLHGHSRDEARLALVNFLAETRAREQRCLRIVHGKGQHSLGREPVLKHWVPGWLSQRQEVLAFCQARPQDGGGGAVIVLLRK